MYRNPPSVILAVHRNLFSLADYYDKNVSNHNFFFNFPVPVNLLISSR